MASLTTPESIVISGANGVTGAPRDHFPDAAVGAGLAVGAFLFALLLLRRGKGGVLGLLLVLAALPGLAEVLFRRADAPLGQGAAVTVIRDTLADLQAHAPWPAVNLAREDDDVLFPLTRYAVPGRAAPPPGAPILETRGALLGVRCRSEAGVTICGAGP